MDGPKTARQGRVVEVSGDMVMFEAFGCHPKGYHGHQVKPLHQDTYVWDFEGSGESKST